MEDFLAFVILGLFLLIFLNFFEKIDRKYRNVLDVDVDASSGGLDAIAKKIVGEISENDLSLVSKKVILSGHKYFTWDKSRRVDLEFVLFAGPHQEKKIGLIKLYKFFGDQGDIIKLENKVVSLSKKVLEDGEKKR